MGNLRGGTTIAGFTALHSGLENAKLKGNLTMGKTLKLGKNAQIVSSYNSKPIVEDYDNGNIVLNGAGGALYLGYTTTTQVRLSKDLYLGNGTTRVINSSDGTLYYKGVDIDTKYVAKGAGYLGLDMEGSTLYHRMVAVGSSSSTPGWIRVGTSSGLGLLPYANNVGALGTSSWQFNAVYSTNFYEGGTALSSKYAAASHNHNSSYVSKSGDTITGKVTITGGTDATYVASTGYLQLGAASGENLVIDSNEIMVRNNGVADHLYLNKDGGRVYFGDSTVYIQSGNMYFPDGGEIRVGNYPAMQLKYGTTTGHTIQIGAGGTTIIGGGESYVTVYDSHIANGFANDSEVLYLASDGNVRIYSGINSGIDSGNLASWTSAGQLKLQGTTNQLRLVHDTHTFMEFYARGDSGSRSGYIGYASATATALSIMNSLGIVTLNGKEAYTKGDQITWGTAAPSGGSNGDVYIQY